MNKTPGSLLASIAILSLAHGGQAVHREDIRKTLTFAAPSASVRRLVIDNINGSINVVGTNESEVTLLVHETMHAETEGRLATAKEQVGLEVTEEPDRIMLYVNAPWRCRDGSIHDRGWDYYGYDATFDFELRVPARTDLYLKTVNEGEINVKNAEGSFRLQNVNGGIAVSGLVGSGEFSTVNGDIEVGFAKNPPSSSSFQTVNGEVHVRFQDDLSADLRLKTFNGEVYTDFRVTSLPSASPTLSDRKRKHVVHGGDSYLVRVGNGGPALSFDTLNGDIYIVKNEER